jgi:hypothetical protein
MTPKRKSSQSSGVRKVLADRRWHSLRDFRRVKGMDTSLSARIRDLRKARHGRAVIECKRFEDGTYRYRMTVAPKGERT